MDVYAPVKGKCMWWREFPNKEDSFDPRLAAGNRRVGCVCFVDGHGWEYVAHDLPADCPLARRCRYHVKV